MKARRNPSIDSGLPPRGRLQYYIVESGQESMAEFNQCFHLLYLAWKLLLAANNMSKKSTPQGNRHRDPPESPLQPLRAREEHARPVESSMRILILHTIRGAREPQETQSEVRPELRPSTATGEAQAPGYEQKHHPLCRLSLLLHQTFCQLRQIPTVGAMSHPYKGEEESPTGPTLSRTTVMSALRAFTRSYIVVLPDSPLPGHPNQRSYFSNQAANPFTPSASTSENDQQGILILRSMFPRSGSLPLGPGSLPPGRGPAFGSQRGTRPSRGKTSIDERKHSATELRNSTSRQGYISPQEDLLLREAYDRLIPAITTMKMTSYALCSTPTTPHTGPCHDLQHTDRDTPYSSKHIEAPCSL
ncbi:hypothetical protein DY000_02060881 [Brassica cretica]|uniref:Uncharacterized protein n=1 Tax=Brassica cretica TaxID=69181 RepID=A0ABQ7AVN9_BRACR|nr:hypothetical protein DY000_02060881 [Brassica cretica]